MRVSLFILIIIFHSCSNSESKVEKETIESISFKQDISIYQVEIISIYGKKMKIKNSGKPIFINFWATWCGPCIAEMPSLLQLKDNMGGEMDFYFLSPEKLERVKSFEEKVDLKLPFYVYDDSKTTDLLGYQALPYTVIFNGEKKVFEKIGATEWNSEEMVSKIKKSID